MKNYKEEIEKLFDCSKYKKTEMKITTRRFKIIELL